MKSSLLSATLILTLATLAGCAHGTMRGSVAMKASDTEAHVCMGDQEVNAGDRVALFSNVCTAPTGIGKTTEITSSAVCDKRLLGKGVVKRTLNSHYSVVEVDRGVAFEEGAIVEKL